MSTLILLYEPRHVEALLRHLEEHPEDKDAVIVICDLQAELIAKSKNLTFVSGRSFFPTDASRFQIAREWPVQMFKHPLWKEFSYREVPLREIVTLHIQVYLLKLLYWTGTIDRILAAHPNVQKLIVFPSLEDTPLKGKPLTREQLDAVALCAGLVAKQRGLRMVLLPKVAQISSGVSTYRLRFAIRQFGFGLAALVWNICINLLPRKKGAIRMLATDYWKSISPLLEQMGNPELVLFDRGEAKYAGFKNLLRFRVRLCNFSSFPLWGRSAARSHAARAFTKLWMTHALLPECSYDGFSFRPLLNAVLSEVVHNIAPQILHDIDGAYALLSHTKPDLVLLRASVSIQTHFTILASVSRALDIPSLELQHGLEYLGPGSLSATHHAEFIAVYGQAIQDEFEALQYSRKNIPIIGSPRFDVYKTHSELPQEKRAGLTVLCITPTIDNEGGDSGYDADTYFTALADALEKIPGARAIIKLRPGSTEAWYHELIHTAFARVPHTIAQKEPLLELFGRADVVASYFSTVLLEALQCGKPVVAVGVVPFEKEAIDFHFAPYLKHQALMIARTRQELEGAFKALAHDSARHKLSEQALQTMVLLHQFDGQSSKRLVSLISDLVHKKRR